MSDLNAFIDGIGKDVNADLVPRVEKLAHDVGDKALTDYVPKVSAFANQLLKEIIDEQSVVVRDFVASTIQGLFARYRPELSGELHTRIVQGGIQITGHNVKLDLKNRQTGASISSLDIPVSLKIALNNLALTVQDATIQLDAIR